MSRVQLASIFPAVVDQSGNAITGASVLVNVHGGSTPATVYAGEVGGTTLTNPSLTALGAVAGWVDSGSYDRIVTWGGTTYPTESFTAGFGLSDPTDLLRFEVVTEAPLNVQYPEYGAVMDGSHNDTAAMVAAHAALPAGGGEILIPPGILMFDGAVALKFTKRVHLRGMGPAVSVVRNRNTAGQHFIWVQADGSTIEDLTIDGQRSAQLAATGTAVQFAKGGGGVLAPLKDMAIRNCEVYGNGFDCIGLTAVDGGRIEGCIVRDVFDTGIDLVEGSRGIAIVDNEIYCAGRFGIALDTADAVSYAPVSGCKISGNKVRMAAGSDVRYGILLQTAVDCSVANNWVDCSAAGQQGIRFDSEYLRGACVGNEVIGGAAVTRGICVEGLTQQLKLVTVEANLVRDVTAASQAGIGSDNAIGVVVQGNVIENCKRGINFEGSTAKPASAIHAARNLVHGCDIGIRFGGTTGTNVAAIGPNSIFGTLSFRYAVDSAWTVHTGGEWDTSGSTGTLTTP